MINDKQSSELFHSFSSCVKSKIIEKSLYTDKSLIGFFPFQKDNITAPLKEIISNDSLLKDAVCFSNGINVYVLLDNSFDKIYSMARRFLKQLHDSNIKCMVLFSGKIDSFNNACMTFAGINWQATQLRISKANVEIVYYDNSLYLFDLYNESISASKNIGKEIKTSESPKVELLIEKFFEKMQQGSLLRSHIHFFVMEMLTAAVGEDVLNDNMNSLLECTNRLQLKNLVTDICLANSDNSNGLKGDNKEQIVEKICQIINNEYNTELSLDIIAKKVFLSPTYVSRIFKECKGVNFTRYIKNLRLNKAVEFFEDEVYADKNINEIAELVGLPNVAFFCASFKEKYGVSPTKYRRNLNN